MSRKYGQRGYMQDEQRDRRGGAAPTPREPPPPRHNLDRPRGRGLGAPTAEVFRCAVCGTSQEAPAADAFVARCGKCGADLHTCTHCAHFDTAVRWECRRHEERAALAREVALGTDAPAASHGGPVRNKSKRNDCVLMGPRHGVEHDAEKRREPDDPRAAFDALFKL